MDVVILKKKIPEYRLQLHALLPQESNVFINTSSNICTPTKPFRERSLRLVSIFSLILILSLLPTPTLLPLSLFFSTNEY